MRTREKSAPQVELLILGDLVLPSRALRDAWLAVRDGHIYDLGTSRPPQPKRVLDFRGHVVLPGFIDVHLHGLEYGDPASAEGIVRMLEAAPRHGVTGIVPTLASATHEQYLRFFDDARLAAAGSIGGARLLGVHAEGPYINPRMARGMDPAYLRSPNPDEDSQLLEHGSGVLKIMTLSPELPGAARLVRALTSSGVTASIGHSAATRPQVRAAVEAGASQVCHWPNALPKPDLEPDLPDTAAFCLEFPELALELILDLVHVPVERIRLALEKAGVERVLAVTDAMRGAGLRPARPAETGRLPVFKMTDGRAYSVDPKRGCRLVDTGVLVGSAITLLEAFRNLVTALDLSLPQAAQICSTNPARQLRLDDRLGKLAPGHFADLTVLDRDLNLVATFVGGQQTGGPEPEQAHDRRV